MDKTLEQELAEAAGETHWRRVNPLDLNEVSLNGSGTTKRTADGTFEPEGGFFRKRLYAGNRSRNEAPEEIDLGKQIRIVFLRKRRKLVQRGTDGKIERSTNEHNHAGEAVMLYDHFTKESETGVAKDIRTKYDKLRTVEIIYALLLTDAHEPELVRIPVKGATLGSKAKANTTTDLYKYISSFTGGEHVWQYETILEPVFETGKMSYFAIDFKKGEKLDDETIANVVAPTFRKVKENIDAVDQNRQERIRDGMTVAPAVEPEEMQQHPEDGIETAEEPRPEDIPWD